MKFHVKPLEAFRGIEEVVPEIPVDIGQLAFVLLVAMAPCHCFSHGGLGVRVAIYRPVAILCRHEGNDGWAVECGN